MLAWWRTTVEDRPLMGDFQAGLLYHRPCIPRSRPPAKQNSIAAAVAYHLRACCAPLTQTHHKFQDQYIFALLTAHVAAARMSRRGSERPRAMSPGKSAT